MGRFILEAPGRRSKEFPAPPGKSNGYATTEQWSNVATMMVETYRHPFLFYER